MVVAAGQQSLRQGVTFAPQTGDPNGLRDCRGRRRAWSVLIGKACFLNYP